MNRTLPCYLARIAVIALLLLTSCAPLRDRRTLNDMEALMPDRPDSALAVLRGLQPRDLPGLHVRPLHALLLSEALDKNYIDLTDDSLALAANRYYGEHGSKLHRLKSWYYLGRIRFNEGNYAEAVICYNKALDYAEALTNYHYMGLINREISNTYAEVWDDIHAIEYNLKSSSYFQLSGEKNYLEYNQLARARMYHTIGQDEKGKVVLDSIADSSNDRYLLAETYKTMANILSSEESISPDTVIALYNKAFRDSLLFPSARDYSRWAFLYALKNKKDTTNLFLKLARQRASTRLDSVKVNYDEYRIADYEKDYKKANMLLESSVFNQDSMVYYALGQSISFYQGSYYQNESRINAIKAKNRLFRFGLLIIVLSMVVLFLVVKNRKQKEQIIDEIARTAEVEKELSEMKNEKIGMNLAMATLFENRMKILQKLSEQYDVLEVTQQQKKKEKGMELSRDEIIDMFRNNIKDLRKDKDIALSMEETLDTWKDGIMRKFRTVFGETNTGNVRMTNEEINLAPYYFSGLKTKTISYLTGFTEPSLRVRKTRIKQKILALNEAFSKEKHLFLDNL